MASNQTKEYGLNQWELSDGVVMEDFNADNRKLEAALQELKNRIPRICCGSYVGDGAALTREKPKVIALEFCPKLVIMTEMVENGMPRLFVAHYPMSSYRPTGISSHDSENVHLVWGENSLSWYTEGAFTFNWDGCTYNYIAIG